MTALPAWPMAMRSAFFMLCWGALGLTKLSDLIVGLVVAVPIAIASLALLPPGGRSFRAGRLSWFCFRFARRSLVAGLDVAQRVLSPTLDVRPGIRRVPCRIPAGLLRQGFCAVASLQPGAVPVGGDDATLLVHCLDMSGPIEDELAADASAYLAMTEIKPS
jgi:multicomponent Na+:H+ antiporter subunit E